RPFLRFTSRPYRERRGDRADGRDEGESDDVDAECAGVRPLHRATPYRLTRSAPRSLTVVPSSSQAQARVGKEFAVGALPLSTCRAFQRSWLEITASTCVSRACSDACRCSSE